MNSFAVSLTSLSVVRHGVPREVHGDRTEAQHRIGWLGPL